jgi:serine protease inhibitor
MNRKFLILTLAILLVALVASSTLLFLFPYNPLEPPQLDSTGSTPEGVQEVVNANNQFAFDLYSQMNKNENIFYSPYSISAALAMTYEGAKGQTAEEMKEVFHFPENSILRPNFAEIYTTLNDKNNAYELRTGNALWIQENYPLLEDYADRVEKYYGGKATNLDFVEETEKSRQTINAFIEEQTNNKIKDLITKGVLNPMTRLVLTNAIYFKGDWEWEFDKSETQDQDFKVTPTNIVKTPMMYMDNDKAQFNYADLEKLQIIELPYKGDELSMLILLPKNGEIYDFEKGPITYNYTLDDLELSSEKLLEYKSEMNEQKMDAIYLPKFELETKYSMNSVLSAMGMPTAFSGNSDFSGMTGTKDLFISGVIHQAYVKVDEKGTEAAAATAVMMDLKSSMVEERIFRADSPFVFIIQQKSTGNILFVGRVSDPTSK